jgi:mannosyltransferase OCH1-like enzyme
MAPAVAGPLVLEVDLVHEHVRWFDRACRIRVLVTEPRSLTDRAPPSWQRRLARRLLPRRRRDEALIPRVIHRIWLGAEPMPADHEALGRTWAAHHPDWEMRLWTDGDLAALVPPDARGRARSPSEASDLLRYEVLRRHGGVYVDTDVESLKPLDGLIKGVSAFAAEELPGRIGTAIIGSVPGHPALERAAREARGTAGLGANSADSTGPRFLTLILADFEDVEIFPPRLFYPYTWHEPERRHEHFPDAYAVHHWAGSWREATGAAP